MCIVVKELIINVGRNDVEIALLEDSRLSEIHYEKTNSTFSVGDIFLGSIRKLRPDMNAAFVDIGHRKDAFIHYTDLGPKLKSTLKFTNGSISGSIPTPSLDAFKIEPDIVKTGKIDQVLSTRDFVLVQMMKEPIGTKGPRLTSEITLPGRYMVMVPFSETVAVSKKIANPEERQRLQVLVESIRPKNFGIIVRTAASGKKVVDLYDEVRELLNKWEQIHSNLHNCREPLKILSEIDKTSGILRDLLNDSFHKVVVNNKEIYGSLKTFVEGIAPEQSKLIHLYKGNKAIFEAFDVTRQIKASFGKTFTMPSGAYIIIESTEAMHVIDVNSGPKVSIRDAENNSYNVNVEAAFEISRQLRLRDIGGLIVIDFIDMKNQEKRKQLYEQMVEFMSRDRAQHTILPLSKFGLMQITRQRVRPEVKINTLEPCPSCDGHGSINPPLLIVDDIQRDLDFIMQSRPKSRINLAVHPFILAYLKAGWKSIRMQWSMKYGTWIRLHTNSDLAITEYKFFDRNMDEIRLS